MFPRRKRRASFVFHFLTLCFTPHGWLWTADCVRRACSVRVLLDFIFLLFLNFFPSLQLSVVGVLKIATYLIYTKKRKTETKTSRAHHRKQTNKETYKKTSNDKPVSTVASQCFSASMCAPVLLMIVPVIDGGRGRFEVFRHCAAVRYHSIARISGCPVTPIFRVQKKSEREKTDKKPIPLIELVND